MRVIVVEDNILFCDYICNFLQNADYQTVKAYRLAQARQVIARSVREDDIVLADLRLPDGESTALLEWMRGQGYTHPFIMMTNYEEIHTAVHAMKLGAEDYILKPLLEDKLLPALKKIRMADEAFAKVIYERKSAAFRELDRYIRLVAPTDMTVLILGNTGTGKEHLAGKIHKRSLRANKPYITVDCGSLSRELAASAFFGHVKGAFTGATDEKPGYFQEARGGTLFLDEVENLPVEIQQMLLRAMEERRYRPVGGRQDKRMDVRVIAATIRMDARLSLIPMQNGQVGLGIHGIRKEPQLERPYFGHIFTEEDKKNLRESGNMGRVAELNLRGGTTEPCLISIDKNTNELVAVRQEHVYVQDEVRGVKLSPDEIQTLKNGGQVFVDGMISNKGKEFSATLQYSAERRGLEFIFPKDQAFNQQSLGGVQLSPTQLKMLSEGHTILVEDMKRRNSDEVFSSFVTLDKVTGRPNYTRHNPETGEIYIPKEICNVQLTHEDKELLRKGQPVFLENMVNRKGEEFSAFVKLNMTTGNPQYSRTPDGFNEQQAPRIPAEVYGHVFTAQERANLQDGKAILISDLKSNGKQFSSYLKVNPGSGQLQYFQDNPDIRRDTSRRATQADNAQQQEQKKSAKQAM